MGSSVIQSVKKAANRQNTKYLISMRHCEPSAHTGCGNPFSLTHKKLATQGVLTYCANQRTTVPMYADAFGLLVLPALVTSASLSKTSFLTG